MNHLLTYLLTYLLNPVPVSGAFNVQFGTELLWYRFSGHALFLCRFMVPVFWYGFLAPISGTYVMSISIAASILSAKTHNLRS